MKYERYEPIKDVGFNFQQLSKKMRFNNKIIKLTNPEYFFIYGMLHNANSDILKSPNNKFYTIRSNGSIFDDGNKQLIEVNFKNY